MNNPRIEIAAFVQRMDDCLLEAEKAARIIEGAGYTVTIETRNHPWTALVLKSEDRLSIPHSYRGMEADPVD